MTNSSNSITPAESCTPSRKLRVMYHGVCGESSIDLNVWETESMTLAHALDIISTLIPTSERLIETDKYSTVFFHVYYYSVACDVEVAIRKMFNRVEAIQ